MTILWITRWIRYLRNLSIVFLFIHLHKVSTWIRSQKEMKAQWIHFSRATKDVEQDPISFGENFLLGVMQFGSSSEIVLRQVLYFVAGEIHAAKALRNFLLF